MLTRCVAYADFGNPRSDTSKRVSCPKKGGTGRRTTSRSPTIERHRNHTIKTGQSRKACAQGRQGQQGLHALNPHEAEVHRRFREVGVSLPGVRGEQGLLPASKRYAPAFLQAEPAFCGVLAVSCSPTDEAARCSSPRPSRCLPLHHTKHARTWQHCAQPSDPPHSLFGLSVVGGRRRVRRGCVSVIARPKGVFCRPLCTGTKASRAPTTPERDLWKPLEFAWNQN